MISVTLDSNIYISALEFGGMSSRILGMARAGVFRIDTSDEILNETVGVLRDKFGWDGYRLHFARMELRKLARVVAPTELLEIAADPDDNRILECATEAGSNFIITADNDLLRLRSYSGVLIIHPAEFLQRLIER